MNVANKSLEELRHDAQYFAQRLPQASSRDEALEIAIKSAETSMQALKLANDPKEKAQLSGRVKRLLTDAEKIKTAQDWRSMIQSLQPEVGASNGTMGTTSKVRTLKEPQSQRKLPTSEQVLLLKAGYLNGFKFPPWTTPPEPSEFELREGEELFLYVSLIHLRFRIVSTDGLSSRDMPELPLSEFQEEVFDAWKRPSDALPPPRWFSKERTDLGPIMAHSREIDLVQDAATDCSVVASMCAGIARVEKGHGSILRNIIHPYDIVNKQPLMSKNGKYIVKLNFNGCFRKVVIDDRIPSSTTTRVIHVVDRLNPGLLWPALIEKAYLKVRGGYDFPGSNSATDIWILSGWIPEQVFLQSDDLEPDSLWRQMSSGFKFGDVLITMGTGKMSCKTERELGLVGEHDYAVLDLREVDGQRLLLIKNPWCEGMSWSGKSKRSSSSEDDDFHLLDDIDEDNEPVQNSRDLLNADDQLSPGCFWMDIDNVIQNFESIYLNWNPGLFAFREDVHFAWDLTPPQLGGCRQRGRFASLNQHPQYTVTAEKGGTVWVLLWRHFQNAVPPDATPEEIEADRYGIELSGHMTLIAFSSDGRRVLLPDKAVSKGWYVDSPQTLLKLECKPGEAVTLVPAEQELPAVRHTFTISAFSNSSVVLGEAKTRYEHSTTCAGSWTKDTAGGNAHSQAYSTNPQFLVAVPRRTSISILLESLNDELNVHVKLVHSGGKRIHTIRNRDIVIDSKDYRRGCCVAEFGDLLPGQYTVVCSTFEPEQLGDFGLLVESNCPTQVAHLPREGAGRVRMQLGTVTFNPDDNRMAAPLVPHRLVKLYAVARYVNERATANAQQRASPSNRSLIRMSIELGRGPEQRTLSVSNGGEHSDSAGGIRTEDIDLKPDMRRFGEMWLVLDRMSVSSEERKEKMSVELFVDQPDAVTCRDWRVVDD